MDKDGGAQVAPYELCTKLMKSAESSGAELKIGTVEGVEKEDGRISHVIVDGEKIPCKAFVCTMGPWAALAQDWFDMPVPMTGIKSTSIVFKDSKNEVEPYALFCGEDDRFGTHLEVYPRNSGEVYLCGIGGSEYVDADELRAGKYPSGRGARRPEARRSGDQVLFDHEQPTGRHAGDRAGVHAPLPARRPAIHGQGAGL